MFLAPGGILACHFLDEFTQVHRKRRPTAPSRLPAPEPSEHRPMPFDECCRLDDDQGRAPSKELCERDHREAERGSGSARLGLAFSKEGELLSEKQILGDQSDSRTEQQTEERQQAGILQQFVCWIEFLRTTRAETSIATSSS